MTRTISLDQEEGEIRMILKSKQRGSMIKMTPEQGLKLAYRLMAYASGGHAGFEIVVREGEVN